MASRPSSTALSTGRKAVLGLIGLGIALFLGTTQLTSSDGKLASLTQQMEVRRSVVDRMLIKLDNGSVSDRTTTAATTTTSWER